MASSFFFSVAGGSTFSVAGGSTPWPGPFARRITDLKGLRWQAPSFFRGGRGTVRRDLVPRGIGWFLFSAGRSRVSPVVRGCRRTFAGVAGRSPAGFPANLPLRSIPPTSLRSWAPPAHEAAGGHGFSGQPARLTLTREPGAFQGRFAPGRESPGPGHRMTITNGRRQGSVPRASSTHRAAHCSANSAPAT